ncbi:MAG TPA: hypothetical protein VEX86_20675 [Longimicrobium sp.]|nr:hypothetical protein [Longimicrobium sp.]
MAYGLIEFLEEGEGRAMLVRTRNGQPTGADGVMDPLSAFIEETSPTLLRQGSPGALYMAQLFAAREQEAGREVRVVGGAGELGITAAEVEGLTPPGYLYEVSFPREGERGQPAIRTRALGEPGVQNARA